MRVLCYGAGAVGSLVGGYLARGGAAVTLLGRDPHMQAVDRYGLALIEGEAVERVRLRATSDADAAWADRPELVILTVKGHATGAVLDELGRRAAREEFTVLSLQNGVGHEESLAAVLGAERVWGGTTTYSASLPEAGQVRRNTTRGGMVVAALAKPESPLLGEFIGRLNQGGMTTTRADDYRSVKWSKLLLNIVGNATSALLDMTPAEMAENRRLFQVELAAVREGLAVMKALGVTPMDLPGFPVRLLSRALHWLPDSLLYPLLKERLTGGRGRKMPSFWVDLSRGRNQSEVEWLNGAIVRAGEELGVATPVNRVLRDLLLEVVAAPEGELRRRLRHRPEELLSLLPAGEPR